MKAWFKILSGKTTSTPAEIAGEIDNLKTEQADVSERLAAAKETLETARLSFYGGQGSQDDVDTKEQGVKALQIEADTLSRALADLDKKHSEAVAAERQAMVAEIDRKIADLRQFLADLRPQYVRAKVMVETFERLFTGPTTMVGAPSTELLLISRNERAEFQAEIDKIVQGHGPISIEIQELQQQKEQLLKG
ncbi:MAG: hypothetical protein K9K63_06115 [Desulfotignum sp.]|nr:hypothetical protein [Desulfotignum sp.]MCF8136870.1 hypothetical protein [Desulfotignum sp.]